MAEAKEFVKKVPREVIVHDNVSMVKLELTEDEAIFLKALMGKIGGPENGLRGIAKNISTALEAVVGKRYFCDDWYLDSRKTNRRGIDFGAETSVATNITETLPW